MAQSFTYLLPVAKFSGVMAQAGGDADTLTGTTYADVIFGDGSGGGGHWQGNAGAPGSGADSLFGGDGDDLIFGDGWSGSASGYGGYGGGGADPTWYESDFAGGLGAGQSYPGAQGGSSWLGPTVNGTRAQAGIVGVGEDNWVGGAPAGRAISLATWLPLRPIICVLWLKLIQDRPALP